MSAGLRTEFIIKTGMKGFSELRDTWNTVSDRMPQRRYFHLYGWYDAYMRHLESHPDSVHFVVGYQGDEPVAIFPLKQCVQRMLGVPLRTLSVPDHPHSPLRDCVMALDGDYAEVMESLGAFLRRRKALSWDVLVVSRALKDSHVLRCLAEQRFGMGVMKESNRCDYIVCTDVNVMLQGLAKSFRQDLRTGHNHLAKMNEVRFTASRDFPELRESFQAFADLEASGWKGEGGTRTAIKLSPALLSFYERVLHNFSAERQCEINLLRSGDKSLAAEFCLVVGDTSYVLKVAYNEEFPKLGSGYLLVESMLRRYVKEGTVQFMNFVNRADWIAAWKPASMGLYAAWLFNRSPRGVFGAAALRTRWAVGRRLKGVVRRDAARPTDGGASQRS